MFLSLFKRKAKVKYSAVINIGSNIISIALVEYNNQNNNSKILAYNKKELATLKNGDFNFFIKNFFNDLEKTVKIVKKENNYNLDRIDCFLPSFLTVSESHLTLNSSQDGFYVNRKILEDISKRVAEKVLSREPLIFPNIIGDRNIIIEKKITDIKINGYNHPISFRKQKINKLELYQYLSLSSQTLVNKIKELVKELDNKAHIFFHTFPPVISAVLPDLLISFKKGFVALDITGGTTDLSFVKDNNIINIISLPKGKDYLIKELSIKTGLSILDTISELRSLKEGRLEKNRASEIKKICLNIGLNWLNDIYSAFDSAMADMIIPEKMVLIGNDIGDKIFIDFLALGDFKKYILGDSQPEIIFMDNNFGDDFLDKNPSVKIKDIQIPLEIYFIKKLLN
ncbi:MAG TPA: hypothetical protein ENN31_00065 [Candidatus Vogelbacteria bacterium]|nr:hypothetical protein [Candidatus Vogelbacteria bacterium]